MRAVRLGSIADALDSVDPISARRRALPPGPLPFPKATAADAPKPTRRSTNYWARRVWELERELTALCSSREWTPREAQHLVDELEEARHKLRMWPG